MTTRVKLALAAVGAAAFLLWSSSAHAAPVDPNSKVTLWQYVTKDGECYLVTFYANGTHSSRKVADSPCDDAVDPTDLGG